MKLVIFTDLDGTLLDAHTYSFEPARDALGSLRKHGIPVVICSSKTRAEIAVWRRRLGNTHPFIVENGGAVYIPTGYFSSPIPSSSDSGGFSVIEFGTPYARLREALGSLREAGFDIRGFAQLGRDIGCAVFEMFHRAL